MTDTQSDAQLKKKIFDTADDRDQCKKMLKVITSTKAGRQGSIINLGLYQDYNDEKIRRCDEMVLQGGYEYLYEFSSNLAQDVAAADSFTNHGVAAVKNIANLEEMLVSHIATLNKNIDHLVDQYNDGKVFGRINVWEV